MLQKVLTSVATDCTMLNFRENTRKAYMLRMIVHEDRHITNVLGKSISCTSRKEKHGSYESIRGVWIGPSVRALAPLEYHYGIMDAELLTNTFNQTSPYR